MRRRTKVLYTIVIMLVIVVFLGDFLEDMFVRVIRRSEVYRAHMYWMSLQPPLDLPEGQDYPIPLKNQLIDARTGDVLQTCDWLDEGRHCYPERGKPGWYRQDWTDSVNGYYASPWWRAFNVSTGEHLTGSINGFRLSESDRHTIAFFDKDGNQLWSKSIDGYVGEGYPDQRQPASLVAGGRVIYRQYRIGEDGQSATVALDAESGETVWKGDFYLNGALATDRLLLTIRSDGFDEEQQHHKSKIVGVRLEDGSTAFELKLPTVSRIWTLRNVPGYLVATNDEWSVILDEGGQELFRTEGEVIDGVKVGTDTILLTSQRILRLTSDWEVAWQSGSPNEGLGTKGELMLLPDGDLLYLTYDRMSDSCETVTRVSADTGRVRWSAWTGAIGVSHSAYFHHAYLDVRGDWVYVVGQASAGDTICVLDLDSGYEERRWIYHFHIVP